MFTRGTGVMKRDIIQKTNVTCSLNGRLDRLIYIILVSLTRNGKARPTATDMTDDNMWIVSQIDITLVHGVKVNVFEWMVHGFTFKILIL